ncbi:amino acid adenylation domain-containing protein [Pseudomonas syringae]|uniref:amino acid adenylation domain-containing protein n=1 Tax=Pseudomonas syringae TaxID=317 RepID=UPI0006A81F96|nr:amino acid adenylation domain-containing protein [Pseudomonas syringae]GAO92945.1 hypothetical protein PSA5_09530 [Pseudomonas syringae pv. actinidiae]
MIVTVCDYLERSAKKFPEKVAVQGLRLGHIEAITYAELNTFSDRFSEFLRAQGATPGEFIPFFMFKEVDSIKSIFSVLKADCAYVPLDCKSPEGRLLSIIQSCKAKFIIVNERSASLAERIFSAIPTLKIINISEFVSDTTFVFSASLNISVDLAYVLFTSGSTGTPKGVMISHQAIIDYIGWCTETYNITAIDHVSNHAPLYFDNSTFDIYTSMAAGATLHLVPEEFNVMLPRLIDWIEDNRISIFFCVPSILTLMLQTGRLHTERFVELKHLICAGEVLPTTTAKKILDLFPHLQLTNMYGPTEITVDCTYHVVREADVTSSTSIPIGKPRRNMQLMVLTDDGAVTNERGATGELMVRGSSVSYGYLDNYAKTQEAFVQNPAHSLYPDMVYKTGDRVTIGEEGLYYYCGRLDNQIKHLGYRIELGEIEANALLLDTVLEAVAVYRSSTSMFESAICMAVKTTVPTDVRTLRAALTSVLPPYMIPGHFVFLDSDFPRTPNGKYDRASILGLFV